MIVIVTTQISPCVLANERLVPGVSGRSHTSIVSSKPYMLTSDLIHLCPELHASIVKQIFHIGQTSLSFSYYFIYQRIKCVVVNFYS